MSPILTRPVREQLEHDRVIRVLEARYRRQHDVAINLSGERNHSVMVGELAVYPDLLLFGREGSKRLQGTVEVETGESVNYLEALSEWGPFSRLRVPFALYVPPNSVDSARRLCAEHSIPVAEIWAYHIGIDQVRLSLVHRAADAQGKGARGPRVEITVKQSDVPLREAPVPPVSEPPASPVSSMATATIRSGAVPKEATAAKAAGRVRPASQPPSGARAAAVKPAPKPAARVLTKVTAKAKGAAKASPTARAKSPVKAKPAKAAKPSKPAKAAKSTRPSRAPKPAAKPVRTKRPAAKSAKSARAARRR